MSERDERLAELALGILEDEARAERKRGRALSPKARDELARVEAALEALALASGPVQPSSDRRAALLRALEPGARFAAYAERLAALFDFGLSRARELLDEVARVTEPPWEDGRVSGVRVLHFEAGPRLAAAHCGLVHIETGVSYPGHRHRGDEWSLVLQGSAEEDGGRRWEAGDLVHRPVGSSHSFRALGDESFVFAAAVHDGIEYDSV